MTPRAPSLYLDPLLPLQLRQHPRTIPLVAGSVPAIGLVIIGAGAVRVGAATAVAPAIVWRVANEEA